MSTYIYDGNIYQSKGPASGLEGYLAASVISGAILSPLAYLGIPIHKQINKERVNNHIYKNCMYNALERSGLKDLGVDILEAERTNLGPEFKLGKNAAYDTVNKKVIINTNKASCLGFHELGHAMNSLKSKYGLKFLAKMRYPGYVIAGIMEYFAIFSRTKPKDAPRNIVDYIEDNCGKITFLAMLPIAIEEGAASIRGYKLAKDAGLSKELCSNMNKLLCKAWTTYGARAVLGGLAVYASRKIMDYFTRPKKVGEFNLFG